MAFGPAPLGSADIDAAVIISSGSDDGGDLEFLAKHIVVSDDDSSAPCAHILMAS